MMDLAKKPHEKIKLVEINPHLTCYLCKGYYIDATTISECLHSFCRSCIIKFLHEHSYCPICEVIINKAKPNLKLDKTLQDIVYKLVPELFLNEMTRRQRFYQSHPGLAAKVTPEERGEDTERTIFNPRDTISLSIEYISDDSTPGAILIPQLIGKGADINNRNNGQAADNDDSAAIKRFLQCPGMCRIDVLKKFIRNKYNVDTNQYYIDILYKRVPLPDHYTLIDIAYIYSWKRNEPMKFFFKITDINLVTDSFDYLIHPQISRPEKPKAAEKKPPNKNAKAEIKSTGLSENKVESSDANKKKAGAEEAASKNEDAKKQEIVNSFMLKEEDKVALENMRKSDDNKEYTNIRLDRSNNVEIITKIQKVSNKNGLPIGIKITKQTVKKPAAAKLNGIKQEKPERKPPERPATPLLSPPPPPLPQSIPEIDPEKSNFLKSIELTAKNVIQAMSPQKIDLPKSGTKRKNPSPVKAERAAKKPKKFVNIQPKSIQNPAVWQMVSNVNQNVSNMTKIVEQMTPNTSASSVSSNSSTDLQTMLFDSYKINIPASLSVTVKNEKDGPMPSPFQKPVQNYIEILKIPDTNHKNVESKESPKTNPDRPEAKEDTKNDEAKRLKLETLPVDVNDIKKEVPEPGSKSPAIKSPSRSVSLHSPKPQKVPAQPKIPTCLPSPAYLPCKVTNMPTRDNFVKLNPRTPQTFQKMFEEAIKKPEFNSKFQTLPLNKNDNSPAASASKLNHKSSLSDASTPVSNTNGKRNILEIASKLYKKNKMELEKSVSNGNLQTQEAKKDLKEEAKSSVSKPLNVPRVGQQRKNPKYHEKIGNPPLKDFNSYISSKQPQPQTVTSLHSSALGLNYTVSVTQATPTSSPKGHFASNLPKQNPEAETRSSSSPKQNPIAPRLPVALSPPLLNVPRKLSKSPKATSPARKAGASPGAVTSSQSENSQPLSPNQILEKYNIQNLAQLTANFNFPSNLCMSPAASPLAAIQQAMIYRHFEMQNHQNWLNMNPSPLMQYEKYLQSLSKS